MLIGAGAGIVKEELPGLFGTSKREAEAQRRSIAMRQAGLTPGAGMPMFGALPDANAIGAAFQGAAIGSQYDTNNVFRSLMQQQAASPQAAQQVQPVFKKTNGRKSEFWKSFTQDAADQKSGQSAQSQTDTISTGGYNKQTDEWDVAGMPKFKGG